MKRQISTPAYDKNPLLAMPCGAGVPSASGNPEMAGWTPALRTRAMTLVEVAMALGIAAFAIIVIVGLLPTGLTSSRDAMDEQAATDLLLQVEHDLRTAPTATSPTPRLELVLPAAAGNSTATFFNVHGLKTTDTDGERRFRVRITRNAAVNPALESWHVVVEWPALAPTAQGWVETTVVRTNPRAL